MAENLDLNFTFLGIVSWVKTFLEGRVVLTSHCPKLVVLWNGSVQVTLECGPIVAIQTIPQ